MNNQNIDPISDIVLKKAKDFELFLNDNILRKYGNMRNIDDKYNRLKLKQEVIAKRAYFTTVKKHYALNITNMEGVPVDEVQIKGLVTQRSDYPSYTKTKIAELLDMLVRDEVMSKTKINTFLDKTKKEVEIMCMSGSKEIARPVSYSKDKSKYKKIPYQISGMDLWNDCMYNYFVPGTKGYLYALNGIDTTIAPPKVIECVSRILNNSKKYIVLPYEEELLPKYFNINVPKMLELAWTARVRELLEPIWGKLNANKKIEMSMMSF